MRSGQSVYFVENLLSGLRGIYEYENIQWADHPVFSRFKDYAIEKEARTEKLLHKLNYNLDASNSLAIVIGKGREEKVRRNDI
jgi:hypothetical protein